MSNDDFDDHIEPPTQDGKDLALASMALSIHELVKEKKALRLENEKLRALLTALVDPPPGQVANVITRARAFLTATEGR